MKTITEHDLKMLKDIGSGNWNGKLRRGFTGSMRYAHSYIVARLIDKGFVRLDENGKPELIPFAIELATKVIEAELAAEKKKLDTKFRKDARIIAWAKENLKIGMMIKVTGARDGLGLRKIIELRPDIRIRTGKEPTWCLADSSTIMGRVYRSQPRRSADIYSAQLAAQPAAYITEHLYKKLKEVQIDGEWINIAKLTKDSK